MTRARLGQLGIGVALASLALGLIEAGIRLYRRAYPSEGPGFFWSKNAAYGWGLTPGREGVVADTYGGQFRVHVRINSLGLHDVERGYAKDPARFRIVVRSAFTGRLPGIGSQRRR